MPNTKKMPLRLSNQLFKKLYEKTDEYNNLSEDKREEQKEIDMIKAIDKLGCIDFENLKEIVEGMVDNRNFNEDEQQDEKDEFDFFESDANRLLNWGQLGV